MAFMFVDYNNVLMIIKQSPISVATIKNDKQFYLVTTEKSGVQQ